MKATRIFTYILIGTLLIVGIIRGSSEKDSVTTIFAGDAITITVNVGLERTVVKMTLLAGWETFTATILPDQDGVAHWSIPTGQVTHADDGLIIAQYDEQEIRYPLRVLPGEPINTDFFATANMAASYGQGSASVLILPYDAWGNAAMQGEPYTMIGLFPDGWREVYDFKRSGDLGWLDFQTQGAPGRVRLTLQQDINFAPIELMQMPGDPWLIDLMLTPDCVQKGGRDFTTLLALVLDNHGNTVVDGTLVRFTWEDGQGYGRTVDGQASLRIPAPNESGEYAYHAISGERSSGSVMLEVTGGICEGSQ